MGQRELHQVIVGAGPGDAITDQTLLIRRWLREMGFISDIFAYHIHEAVAGEVRPIAAFRPRARREMAGASPQHWLDHYR
jgi:hypothetical protein